MVIGNWHHRWHNAHALQKFVAGDECCEMPPFLPHNWPSGSDPLNCGLDTDVLAGVYFFQFQYQKRLLIRVFREEPNHT